MTRGAIKYKPKQSNAPQEATTKKKKSKTGSLTDQPVESFPSTPEWVTDRDSNATTPIFFWKPEGAWGFLGQWYSSPFRSPLPTDCHDGPDCEQCEAERKRFSCCEQYMMYQKAMTFNDTQIAAQIMTANGPRKMKALGRTIKGFNEYTWDQVKSDVVIQANLLKFGKEEVCEAGDGDGFIYGGTGRQDGQERVKLRDMLLSTGTRELVEASSFDRIWGIGFSPEEAREHGEGERLMWGKNLLGKSLMEVRRRIRVQEGLEKEQGDEVEAA